MNIENPFDMALTGQEIKDWIWYNAHKKTKYTSIAQSMSNMFNLDSRKIYMLKLCDGIPVADEVEERGVKYDIPCMDKNARLQKKYDIQNDG